MPVYRCNRCGSIAETLAQAAGEKIACGACGTPVTLFDTPFYVTKLVERYLAIRRELESLKQREDAQQEAAASEAKAASIDKDELYCTATLATELQHQPLLKWFSAKQVKPSFDYAAVNTTGFFDEAALAIGNQHELLAGILEQVRYGYRREWSWLNIDLDGKLPDEARRITNSVRELYSQSFFSRFTFNKQKNVVGVGLQPALPIRRFFEGGWLEWWAFMCLLECCSERGIKYSCARGVELEFHNGDKRELDVAFLLRDRFPIFIECKTGEFRAEIDKYVTLRRRLGIDRTQFVICSPDLSDDQTAAFTSMYDLTFVNLQSFAKHLNMLVA